MVLMIMILIIMISILMISMLIFLLQYEKKNFREPLKAQAREQGPHPLIRSIHPPP